MIPKIKQPTILEDDDDMMMIMKICPGYVGMAVVWLTVPH